MKLFNEEFDRFAGKLQRREPFALSRFADGELAILRNTDVQTPEFSHRVNEQDARGKLYEALTYRAPNYHVGISCPCCDATAHATLTELSGQDQDHLTYSNIWVNANYTRAREMFVGLISTCRLVCNSRAERVAWRGQYAVSDRAALHQQLTRELVEIAWGPEPCLIAAGPITGWLVMHLHAANPHGTFIDIGSVLDPPLGLGNTRGYHRGEDTARKVCTWTI